MSKRPIVPCGVQEKFVLLDGHRMRYLDGGHGETLLFIHGLMGYSFSWSEVLPELARHFRVIAPDMLNLGYSDRADVDPSLTGAAQRMLRFMDLINLPRASLIGSSHGGAIAMKMTVLARSRIARLVLVSPAHPWSEKRRWQINLFSTGLGTSLAAVMALAPVPWMAIGLHRLYRNASKMRPGTVAGYARPMRDRRTMKFLLKAAKCWYRDFEQLGAELSKIKDVPTQLIWGNCDPIVRLAAARRLQDRLAGAQLASIEGCGHLPYEEAPEEFVSAVQSFFDREGVRRG